MSTNKAAITKTINSDISADDFTEGAYRRNTFNVSIWGAAWVATVTLQRSFDGSTWLDVETFTANEEVVVDEAEAGVQYRIGTKDGDYTSGSVSLRIGAQVENVKRADVNP